jgi:hypothetical protein
MAMSKKVLAVALFFIMVLPTSVIDLVSANPTLAKEYYPKFVLPNDEPPTLSVFSPTNGTVYNSTEVELNFTIIKPDSWYRQDGEICIGEITEVEYYLDPTEKFGSGKHELSANDTVCDNPSKELGFSIVLKDLTEGFHVVKILAEAVTYYYPFENYSFYVSSNPMVSNTMAITFDVSSHGIHSPSVEPTIEPTSTHTATSKPQSGFLGTNLPIEYGYAIVAVLVIAVVAGLGLVYLAYLKKHHSHSPKN